MVSGEELVEMSRTWWVDRSGRYRVTVVLDAGDVVGRLYRPHFVQIEGNRRFDGTACL